ncbi:HET-domain-containing protein, partial [Ophiobolus disseminans]
YVALSYCWGRKPEENYMTNVASFRARTDPDGFPRSGLPATIRDAVTVTESLGIKYIWVDALCMIQDDIVDKHSELGKMSQYYRNSFLTIAASTPSCTTGFVGTVGRCEKHLDSPLPRDVVPFDVFAHLQDKDEGRAGKVYVREENIYRLHEEPINKRAWTLQECILAPRVLLFGSRVIWFCQHMTHSDGGVEDWSFGQNELERTRREFQIELNKLDKEGSNANKWADTTSNQDIYDLWHRLVGEYSSRALSWPADKFPAISAVAAEFSKLTSDEYLAGLWRSNLPRDLLWTTPEAATHRPNTWRAPSWSWASVEDAVFYNQPPPKNVTLLAAVLEVDAVPLTDMAPFGEVARCNLVLTAPSFPMKLTDEADREEYSKPWLKDFKFKPGRTEREMLLESLKLEALKQVGTSDGNADEDVKKEFRLPNEMFVVCIYGKRNELFRSNDTGVDLEDTAQEWTMWGLILKKAGEESGEQVFERVLSFSQVMVGCDDAFLSRREQFRII